MKEFVKPNVVVSKCLEFAACRYNGQVIPDNIIAHLQEHVNFLPVCPEVAIGLGTPRKPIRLVFEGKEQRLIQPSSEKDLTEKMSSFSQKYLSSLKDIDGFILKYGSPSCGLSNVKIYNFKSMKSQPRKGPGMFGAAVLEKFPLSAIEDEGRLRNARLREHYLTRLFALARLREVKNRQDLISFQQDYKYVLQWYSQVGARALGRIVAQVKGKPFTQVKQEYLQAFAKLLSSPPKEHRVINVLLHLFGGISDKLSRQERAYFLDLLEEFRDERIPLSVPLKLLQSWAVRFENSYLLDQAIFSPFPDALKALGDSGKKKS